VPSVGPHDEEPLGVRAVPAGGTIAAGLHRADIDARPRATTLDLWAIRVFGTITAVASWGCWCCWSLRALSVPLPRSKDANAARMAPGSRGHGRSPRLGGIAGAGRRVARGC
jgi:hypothetical protein